MKSASAHADPERTGGSPSAPRRAKPGRHLRAVQPDEFAAIVEQAEEATGAPSEFILGLLAGVITAQLPEETRDTLFADAPDPGPGEVADWLRAGEVLQASLREFMDGLRRSAPTEVNSTEVRSHWADYLELVRVSEHTIYITQHGKRVAALVPTYVAESFESDQTWFWTREWQEKERDADADVAAGRVTRFESDEAFLAALAEETEGA